MAVELERKVTIKRPVEDVFAFMSDAENDAVWRTNVKEIERVGGGDHSKVGTVYKQVLTGPGKGFKADLRYTEYEPNKRVAFETINGSVRPNGTIDFDKVSDDTSTVHIRLVWQPTGAMRLLSPMIARILKSNMDKSYDNLVRMLEAHEEEAARAKARGA